MDKKTNGLSYKSPFVSTKYLKIDALNTDRLLNVGPVMMYAAKRFSDFGILSIHILSIRFSLLKKREANKKTASRLCDYQLTSYECRMASW